MFMDFVDNFFMLMNELSLFLLIGLFAAGVLKQLVSSEWIVKQIGSSKAQSVIKATVFGVPLPLCSCSVLPLAKSLHKQGASKGSVQGFLISTPITGIDSIMATYALFGPFFTAYRVMTSMVIAIVTGLMQNVFDKQVQASSIKPRFSATAQPCCGVAVQKQEKSSCCSSDGTSEPKLAFDVKKIFTYGYGTLFKDIYLAMFIGIVIGALLSTFVPKSWMMLLFDNQLLTYLVVIAVSMPLYICATASLPLGAAFVLNGMSGGAAFIFLTAGPATSSIAMSVVGSMFGKKSLLLYLTSILSMSLLFGYLYDLLFGDLIIFKATHDHDSMSLWSQVATGIVLMLSAYYFATSGWQKYFK